MYKVPGHDEYLVTRFDDVVQVLRNTEVFSNALARGDRGAGADVCKYASTIASDPPEHKVKRSLSARHFSPGRLREYAEVVERVTDELIDEFVDEGRVEFVDQFATPLPIRCSPRCSSVTSTRTSSGSAGGRRWRDQGPPISPRIVGPRPSRGRMDSTSTSKPRFWIGWPSRAHDVLSEIVAEQIARDGELNLRYLKAEAGLLLAGGFATTAHLIANAMYLMLSNRDVLESAAS